MTDEREPHANGGPPHRWEIRVEGRLDDRWRDWFEGMALTPEPGDRTLLSGPLADPAALHGLLKRLRDLGAAIVSVARLDPPAPNAGEDRRRRNP